MEKEKIPERDKPFILAVASLILFAGQVGAGVSAIITGHPEVVEFLKYTLAPTIGFVQGAWTYYLTRKKEA